MGKQHHALLRVLSPPLHYAHRVAVTAISLSLLDRRVLTAGATAASNVTHIQGPLVVLTIHPHLIVSNNAS